MNLAEVEAAFRERTGLDPSALGASVFPRAVETRMGAKTFDSPEDYLACLTTDRDEADTLAAELVVPETWFFRGGRDLFARLAGFVASRAATRDTANPVRVLCLPCSTGEEPYSLAIALREAGVPREVYGIDAIDLSPRHLASAMRGRYTSGSFREPGEDIRPASFQQREESWEINADIRGVVRFRRGNVVNPDFLQGEQPYDLILSRNLFIYLTPVARRQAMATFDRLLVADGRLCLTAAEADRLPSGRFVPEGPIAFGIYRRRDTEQPVTRTEVIATPGRVTSPRRGLTASPRAIEPVASPTITATPASLGPNARHVTLEEIRKLADAGQLDEARAACERLLLTQPDSAPVHTLLGVIHLADGHESDAAESLRKALYLDPGNAEALTHMIGVCERRGDATRAAALRNRLARTREEGSA